MRLVRLLGVLGLTLALPACFTGDPGLAASVGDSQLSVDEAADLYTAYTLTPEFEQLQTSDPESAPAQGAATVVGNWVVEQLLQAGAAQLDVEVTDDEVTEALELQIQQQLGSQEAFDQLLVDQGITEETIREQLRAGLLREQLAQEILAGVEISESDIEAAYEANFAVPGVRAIVTQTEEEAQDALDRIAGGEDFAEVAAEVSIDSSGQQGGEVGSLAPGAFPPDLQAALEEAEDGDLVGPLPLQDVFVIAERGTPPSLEDVRDQIESTLRDQLGNPEIQAFTAQLFEDADVVVNPRFGLWDPATGTVVVADPLGDLEPVAGAAVPTAPPVPVATPSPTG